MNVRLAALLTALIGIGAFGAGCGSDSDSTTADTGGGASSVASTTAKAPARSLTGKPVVISDVSDKTGVPGLDFYKFPQGEQVAIDYINNELGGLDGRPFRLISCDSQLDPAATAACARKAVQERPVTEMGLSILLATNGARVFHDNGIPTMNLPNLPADAVDENNFPIGGANYTMVPAMAQYWGEQLSVSSAASLQSEDPASVYSTKLAVEAFKSVGVDDVTAVNYPNGSADLTPYIAKVSTANPEIVVQLTGGGTTVRFYKTAQQQGLTADRTVNTASSVDADMLKKAGAPADGAFAVTDLANPDDIDDPQVKTYLDAYARYGPGGDPRNYFMEFGFANVMTVYDIAKRIGADRFDAASLMRYLKTTPEIPVFLGKTMNTQTPIPGLPGIRNTHLQVVQWKDGRFVTVEPFFRLNIDADVWQKAGGS